MTEAFYTSVERYGKSILFRGYHNGIAVKQKIPFKPTLYIPTNEKDTKYKTLFGQKLEPFKPGDMKEASSFIKDHEDISNFDVYGNQDFVAQFICQNFADAKPDKDLMNILTFDIEVDSENGFPEPEIAREIITSISAKSSLDDVYRVWTLADYDPKQTILEDITIEYHKFDDEKSLILAFLEFWKQKYPDIITGWSIEHFDVPYLFNRITKLFGEDVAKTLSPWGLVWKKALWTPKGEEYVYNLRGVQTLDYIHAFKKFAYNYPPQESYKLDHIAHVVLDEKKVDYDEYGSLHKLFRENPQLFVDYSIKDTLLVVRMDEKEDLLNLIMVLAYKGGVNFEDTFGSVKIWDTYIYKELLKNNIVIPKNEIHEKMGHIKGGHVKHPYSGMHDYVASYDLNSLYPHIIMQYNMSPETIDDFVSGVNVDDLLDGKEYTFDRDKYCMAASGQLFKKNKKGVLPHIVEELYDERTVFKSKKKEEEKKLQDVTDPYKKREIEKEIAKCGNMQMAVKILMNSLYGAMSNKYFRYFDDRIAESITLSGQLAIRWAEKSINKYLNNVLKSKDYDFVIGIDTDSLYLRLGKLVDAVFDKDDDVQKKINFMDKVCETKIGPEIERSYEEMKEYLAAPVQKMEMKREILADRGIWTKKKRYVLNVYDDEGLRYKEPKTKVVGLESKRSDIPALVRKMIEDTFSVIMLGGEQKTQDFIAENRKRFKEFSVEEIAFSKTASEITKFFDKHDIYRKSTPIHVRGALLYNYHLKNMGLDKQYESIYDGDKVKYVYLKIPNPIKENVVSFVTFLPEEFDLHCYVDYDTQFDKSYLVPIQSILDVLGWTSELQGSLEDFMHA